MILKITLGRWKLIRRQLGNFGTTVLCLPSQTLCISIGVKVNVENKERAVVNNNKNQTFKTKLKLCV